MLYVLISALIAALTYASLQTEVSYFGTEASFYINMMTHFLGGAFTASGTLAIRSIINQCIYYSESLSGSLRIFHIPRLPVVPLMLIVLIVGLVWEVWEFAFRASTLMSIDTTKDVIMDMLGAYCIGALFGRYQHD